MRIEYHRTLIADRVRNEAFHAALKAAIVPGETIVADIGAGTGLLGLMAAKLGAKEVFLYETAEVARVAERAIKANRARNCHLIPCHSTEMEDPPPADLVISETLGNYPFEENIIDTLNDARARFLNPGGRLMPVSVTQYMAPVVSDRIAREMDAWSDVGFGIDLSAARALSVNNIYVRTIKPDELFSEMRVARKWDQVNFIRKTSSARSGGAAWTPTKPSTIHGFATWWSASLGAGVTLSTAPDTPRTHWEQLYYPLAEPINVGVGETITFEVRSRSSEEDGTRVNWTATRSDRSGERVEVRRHSLDRGYLP